jgi:hypothetical protein
MSDSAKDPASLPSERTAAASAARAQPSVAGWIRGLIIAGFLFMLVTTAVFAIIKTVDAYERCKGGAFSRGFSADFDRPGCDLIFKIFGGPQIRLPLDLSPPKSN